MTASGGGTNDSPARTMLTICPAFTPTRMPTTATSPTMTTTHCLVLLFMNAPEWNPDERGLQTPGQKAAGAQGSRDRAAPARVAGGPVSGSLKP